MSDSQEQVLISLKEKIESKKTEKDRLQGQLDEKYRVLKSDYNCNTTEEANEYIDELQEESEQLTQTITKELEDIKRILADDYHQ